MDNVQELERELRGVLSTKADGVEFVPARGVEVLRRARRRIARNAAIAGVTLAVVVYGVTGITRSLSDGQGVKPRPAQTPSTGLLTPFGNSPIGDVVARIPVGEYPTTVTLGEAAVWVLEPGKGIVSRIDPKTNAIAQSDLGFSLMAGLGVGFGSAWVLKPETAGAPAPPDPRSTDPRQPAMVPSPASLSRALVLRVDPVSRASTAIALPSSADPVDVAVGEGAVWVSSSGSSTVFRIDPATNRVVASIPIPNADLWSLVTFQGAVWVYTQDGAGETSLVPIDAATNRVDEAAVVGDVGVQPGLPPTGLVAGEGSLWVTECFPGRPICTWDVLRIDPKAGRVIARIPVGSLKNGIVDGGDGTDRAAVVAVDGGRVWVVADAGTYGPPSPNGHARILEIDPATDEVVSSKDVGDVFLYGAAFGEGAVWAADIQDGQVLRFAYPA